MLEGPPTAGMIVVTAQRGGAFRETLAIAKAYVEARNQHGESELLDEIMSAKPKIQLLEQKATPEELDDYKRFVLNVADKVANAHRENGDSVSPDERVAIEAIAASLSTTAPES